VRRIGGFLPMENFFMINKLLDPQNDVAFKKIFGSEKNKDILIHFLNDILTFKEGAPIKEVTFLKTIQNPEVAFHKTSVVDILCKDEKGNTYIVEMQVVKEKGFEKRAQYYAAKAYVSQAHKGGLYENLKEIIFLAISNFIIFPEKKGYKSEHVILDKKSYEHDLKDFSFTFLELPKFHKTIGELRTIEDKWMYFFKNAREMSKKEMGEVVGEDPIIEKAYKELKGFSWDEEELLLYEQAQKYEWDNIAILAQKLYEGEEIGKEIGRVEGMAEGIRKIVHTMRAKGMGKEAIISMTGLSGEEVEKFS
jgi:predicted transposase/invertase (TIGR01784 family)